MDSFRPFHSDCCLRPHFTYHPRARTFAALWTRRAKVKSSRVLCSGGSDPRIQLINSPFIEISIFWYFDTHTNNIINIWMYVRPGRRLPGSLHRKLEEPSDDHSDDCHHPARSHHNHLWVIAFAYYHIPRTIIIITYPTYPFNYYNSLSLTFRVQKCSQPKFTSPFLMRHNMCNKPSEWLTIVVHPSILLSLRSGGVVWNCPGKVNEHS